MSDAVLTALIGTAGLVVVALLNRVQTTRLGRRLGGVEEKTEAVREQVQNSHRSNFRDDHDEVRDDLKGLVARFDRFATATAQTHRRIESKVDAVKGRLEAHIDGATD